MLAAAGERCANVAADRTELFSPNTDDAGLIGDHHIVIAGAEPGGGAPGRIHPGRIGFDDDIEMRLVPRPLVGHRVAEPVEKGFECGRHGGDPALFLEAIDLAGHHHQRQEDEDGAADIEQKSRQSDDQGKGAQRLLAEGLVALGHRSRQRAATVGIGLVRLAPSNDVPSQLRGEMVNKRA